MKVENRCRRMLVFEIPGLAPWKKMTISVLERQTDGRYATRRIEKRVAHSLTLPGLATISVPDGFDALPLVAAAVRARKIRIRR